MLGNAAHCSIGPSSGISSHTGHSSYSINLKMQRFVILYCLVQSTLALQAPRSPNYKRPSINIKPNNFLQSKNKLQMLGSSQSSKAPPINPSTDFQYLKKLDARVKRLSDGESDYLLSFWSDSLKCFQIYPNMNTTRVSVTTTCMTISAILANPTHWQRSCRWDEIPGGSVSDGTRGKCLLILIVCMCYKNYEMFYNEEDIKTLFHLISYLIVFIVDDIAY